MQREGKRINFGRRGSTCGYAKELNGIDL